MPSMFHTCIPFTYHRWLQSYKQTAPLNKALRSVSLCYN
jgi:hypothetical protein